MLIIGHINRASSSAQTYTPTAIKTSTKTCQPYGASTDPGALPLATASAGLTQVIDTPTSYRIFGATNQDLEQQVAACAPKDTVSAAPEFTAQTSYRLNWQYDFLALPDGSCSLHNIKLGLHIGMVLPQWIAPPEAQAGLADQWQTFMMNLQTHENGHVALDVQHSQQLLTELQTMPASDCNTITAPTATVIDQAIKSLNQANDDYDSATNHGATQGAILP